METKIDVNTAEATAPESSTENKPVENTEATAEKPNEKPAEESFRGVPYERYNEVNREAKLARKIKQHLGMSDEEILKVIENGTLPEAEEEVKTPSNLVAKRLNQVEEVVEELKAQRAQEAEDREWRETVAKNPDLAPFKDQIVELGRTNKYKKQTYANIYKQVFEPVVKTGFSRATERYEEKTSAQLHKGGEGSEAALGEITREEFARLPLNMQEKYLKEKGLM